MIPTIVGISIIIFLMVRLMPGDIVDVLLGGDAVNARADADIAAAGGESAARS